MPTRLPGGHTLADRVYAILNSRIQSGVWNAGERLPSERALSEELGVCRVTTARALHRLVAEGVLRRRRGSGTFVNGGAEEARPATGDVALVIPYSRDGYVSHIVKGVADVLSDAGRHMLFHDTHGDARREALQLQRLRGRVDGLLVFPSDTTRNHGAYASFLAEGTPLVFLDRYCPTLTTDWVVTDNYAASLEAVRRLIGAGRRRIVHVTTSEGWCTAAQDRRLGFAQALLEAGYPARSDDVRIINAYVFQDVSTRDGFPDIPDAPWLDAHALIADLLCDPTPIDAIFAVNDWSMLACLHALRQIGARVPDDVAMAAFSDNDLVTHHLPVPVLAVSQQKHEMGRLAACILLDRLAGDSRPPRQVFLPADIREAGGAWTRS